MAGEDRERALAALQTELAFQGDALQALNDAFADQQRALLALQRQVELLTGRLRELGDRVDEAAGGEEPPPPHY